MMLQPASLKDPNVCPQRGPVWFQQRLLRISASDVPKLLGQSNFGNAASVLVDKQQTGSGPTAPTRAQQYGVDHEQDAVDTFLRVNSSLVSTCKETGLWVHPEQPWLCASPDRILELSDGTPAVLEVKCFAVDPGKELPHDIYLQVMHSCSAHSSITAFRQLMLGCCCVQHAGQMTVASNVCRCHRQVAHTGNLAVGAADHSVFYGAGVQVAAQLAVTSACGLFGAAQPTAYVCVADSRKQCLQLHRQWKVDFNEQQWLRYQSSLWGVYKLRLLPAMAAAEQRRQQDQQQQELPTPWVDRSWLFLLQQRAAAELQQQRQQQQQGPAEREQQQQQDLQGSTEPGGNSSATPRQLAAAQAAAQVDFTPTIREGKPVMSLDTGPDLIGVVKKLFPSKDKVEVKWDGRSSTHSTSRVIVRPIAVDRPVCHPQQAEQMVIGVFGRYNGQRGTVRKHNSQKCTVEWEGGKVSSVDIKHLHVLGSDQSTPEAAAATGAAAASSSQQVRQTAQILQ